LAGVGAGSAGCVIAARLSEDENARVLLLEAGGPDSNPDIHIPANAWQVWMTENDWWLPTAPQKGAAGRVLHLPRGKVLGGSSSLNAMIYIRGNRADYDHWAYLGNAGWDYENVLPYFKKSEDYWGGAGRYHGAGGPLTVSRIAHPNPLTEAFLEAAQAVGVERNDDFAGASPLGVGLCDLTVRDGRRCSAAAAFPRRRPSIAVRRRSLRGRGVLARRRCPARRGERGDHPQRRRVRFAQTADAVRRRRRRSPCSAWRPRRAEPTRRRPEPAGSFPDLRHP
jgi:choline dehydrogenase